MKHTNWDSCSVSSSRPASASAGLQEYNCMNIKQGSAGIRAWTSAEKTLIHADSELIPTWGTSVHVCDTADIMPPVPYSLDMLTCSWEHLSSDSVWSYVTCTSGACIRPRPSRVYRTHSRGALQCRPMISLHVHCLWLYMQRAGGSRRISELRWTNMFSLFCTTVQFEQHHSPVAAQFASSSDLMMQHADIQLFRRSNGCLSPCGDDPALYSSACLHYSQF